MYKRNRAIFIGIFACLVTALCILNYVSNKRENDVFSSEQLNLDPQNISPLLAELSSEELIEQSDFVGKVKVIDVDELSSKSTSYIEENETSKYAIDRQNNSKSGNEIKISVNPDAIPDYKVLKVTLSIIDLKKDNVGLIDTLTLLIPYGLIKEINTGYIQVDEEYLACLYATSGGYYVLTSYDKGIIALNSQMATSSLFGDVKLPENFAEEILTFVIEE